MTKINNPTGKVNRREFISGLAVGSTALLSGNLFESKVTAAQENSGQKYKLNYAPHFGMFKNSAGEDPIDQLKFIADQGFTALEDNGMMEKPIDQQESIASEMTRLGLMMGVFVAYADFKETTFVTDKSDVREMLIKKMEEVCRGCQASQCQMVHGSAWLLQYRNGVGLSDRSCD